MSDYRLSTFEEQGYLRKSVNQLKEFIVSDKYDNLSDIEKSDLKEQLKHMKAYHKVLLRRVSRQCNSA